jgi:RimJ/RimL family protein N-acetyltransferase
MNQIETDRLILQPLDAEAVDALVRGDADAVERATGAGFPRPAGPPPLMEGALPLVRDRLRTNPEELGWWTWLVVHRETRFALGAVGFGGPPNQEGEVVMGYATYPARTGKGYATEAAGALARWALTQPGVRRVCCTIPPWNEGALRVARKIGMRQVGTIWEEDTDEVLLFAIERAREGGGGR